METPFAKLQISVLYDRRCLPLSRAIGAQIRHLVGCERCPHRAVLVLSLDGPIVKFIFRRMMIRIFESGPQFLAAVSSRLRWFMSMESTIRRVLTLVEILSLATEGARRNGKANTLAKTEGCAVSMRHIDGTTERLAVNL